MKTVGGVLLVLLGALLGLGALTSILDFIDILLPTLKGRGSAYATGQLVGRVVIFIILGLLAWKTIAKGLQVAKASGDADETIASGSHVAEQASMRPWARILLALWLGSVGTFLLFGASDATKTEFQSVKAVLIGLGLCLATVWLIWSVRPWSNVLFAVWLAGVGTIFLFQAANAEPTQLSAVVSYSLIGLGSYVVAALFIVSVFSDKLAGKLAILSTGTFSGSTKDADKSSNFTRILFYPWDLEQAYQPDIEDGGLFVPTERDYAVGDAIPLLLGLKVPSDQALVDKISEEDRPTGTLAGGGRLVIPSRVVKVGEHLGQGEGEKGVIVQFVGDGNAKYAIEQFLDNTAVSQKGSE